ncbi:MAG: NINE protein [Spirochaetes bacterium]|nr:NINE protein [Spirochaetota bacterium]
MYAEVRGEKDRLLLLCAVGGYFGLHRFFAGRWITGLIWLFTAGVFFIGWFIDLILIAIGKFKDKNGFDVTN